MNAATRELFRHNLIAQLCANGAPMRVPALKVGAMAGGFAPTDDEIDAELLYLADKGLVVVTDKLVSPELKRWRVTADGRDYAATEGLA